jgi:hypothetical protein
LSTYNYVDDRFSNREIRDRLVHERWPAGTSDGVRGTGDGSRLGAAGRSELRSTALNCSQVPATAPADLRLFVFALVGGVVDGRFSGRVRGRPISSHPAGLAFTAVAIWTPTWTVASDKLGCVPVGQHGDTGVPGPPWW